MAAVRILCPVCGGGSDGEMSFSANMDLSGVVLNGICWRASCGYRIGRWTDAPRDNRDRKHFTADTRSLTDEQADWFKDTFGYEDPCLLYAPTLDRFVYEVSAPYGASRGVIARSFSGGKPKSLSYPNSFDTPFIGWAGHGHDYVVIVEDWVSAEKVGQFTTAVALNGSTLSVQMMEEVTKTASGRRVVLALDMDCYSKALGYVNKYSHANLRVWRLAQDLKYEPLDRIEKALRDGEFDFG